MNHEWQGELNLYVMRNFRGKDQGVFSFFLRLYQRLVGGKLYQSSAKIKEYFVLHSFIRALNMEAVEIPTTNLPQEMQKKLGFTSPMYKTCMSGEAKLVAWVTFYPATHCLGFTYGEISVRLSYGGNNDAAKQSYHTWKRLKSHEGL